jgi:hypothetical protein
VDGDKLYLLDIKKPRFSGAFFLSIKLLSVILSTEILGLLNLYNDKMDMQ